MKRVVFLVTFLFSLQSFCQEKSYSVEIETKAYFIKDIFRLNSGPKLFLNCKKHQFGFGPTFLLTSLVAASEELHYPKLVGIQASYRYFPNGFENRINVFLFQDMTLQMIPDKYEATVWNQSTSQYESFNYVNREFLNLLNAGYGIQFKLADKLTISQSIGIGFYYSHTDGDELTQNAPELKTEDQNINGYKKIGFTYGANIGFHYKF